MSRVCHFSDFNPLSFFNAFFMIKNSRRIPAFCVVERSAFNWVYVAGELIEVAPYLLLCFIGLNLKITAVWSAWILFFWIRRFLQKKFFEFTPRAMCAMPDCALSTKFARAHHSTYLSTVFGLIIWVFFTAHTLRYNNNTIFLNLYFSHPDTNEGLLQRVSKARVASFVWWWFGKWRACRKRNMSGYRLYRVTHCSRAH